MNKNLHLFGVVAERLLAAVQCGRDAVLSVVQIVELSDAVVEVAERHIVLDRHSVRCDARVLVEVIVHRVEHRFVERWSSEFGFKLADCVMVSAP